MSAIKRLTIHFKRAFSKSTESENPYLNARRTWNGHVASVISSRFIWQMVALLSLMITLAAVGGVIKIGSQSKFVPYVVLENKLGQTQAQSILSPTTPVDPRVIKSTLAEFIENARMVTPDSALEYKAVYSVYAHIKASDPAFNEMNQWMNGTADSSPFVKARKHMVDVQIDSVLQQSPTTWQVQWTESTRDRQGVLEGQPIHMRALLTVYVAKTAPQDEKTRLLNPLGIYVRNYSWSALQ